MRRDPPAVLLQRYRYDAWAVLFWLALVVTGYLAWGARVSAHDPAWLYVDNVWWRRTGTVLAWRVDEATVIHTLEGRAIAEAGDWIVQGAAGERWPVKPGQFTQGHAAVQGETTAPEA
jgi:hypothetical protein